MTMQSYSKSENKSFVNALNWDFVHWQRILSIHLFYSKEVEDKVNYVSSQVSQIVELFIFLLKSY